MTPVAKTVFLLDVDNTLLDNDALIEDLRRHLLEALGVDCQQRYWSLFEACRRELGYADYLGALQRYRARHPRDSHVLTVSQFLVNYPFANRLFPESLDVVERARAAGPAVIVSDGDVVFQPRKIERSGLMEAVDRNILIYVHKEQELDDVERRYPAEHYVMVDDKLWLLHAIKRHWGGRVTTVWPKQGHYVSDARVPSLPRPDVTLERIGELLAWTPEQLRQSSRR
jgi:FMN phosphatase YigB (HAD superfamily)